MAHPSETTNALLAFAEKLKSRDSNWNTLREELAELFLPNRQGFLGDEVDGEERMDRILSSAPLLARRGLATAVSTMLRPPGRTWFACQAYDDRLNMVPRVRQWCEAVTAITYDAMYDPRAHMEANLAQADDDLVTFGTAIIRVGWDSVARHLKYKTHSLAGTYLICDAVGEIMGAIIEYPDYTLSQIIERFGEDKLTDGMKQELKSSDRPDMEKKFPLLHTCVPAKYAARFGIKAKNGFEYVSVWTSITCREHIDVGGYYDFAYLTPRWDTSTGEIYGRSPAMVALNDARLLQAMTEDFLEAGHLALRPPTYSAVDMINGPLELWAGGHTQVNMMGMAGNSEPIRALQLGALPQGMFDVMNAVEQRIGAAFFRDILELPSARDKDLTATEINARLDQYMRQAAPVFSRIEHNYNAPHVNRVFSILSREGMFPDPPPELQGQPLKFVYESPIKVARDKAEALKVIEGVNYLLPAAEAFPDMLDNFDPDGYARYTGVKLDLPEALFKPIEAMEQMRAERAKKMKMAEMAELASKAGPALAQMGGLVPKAAQAGLMGNNQMALPAPDLGFDMEAAFEGAVDGADQFLTEQLAGQF